MAGIMATATTVEIALSASATKTVLQIAAPTNQRVKILRWGVSFDEKIDDASDNAVIQVVAGKQTGGTGSSNTPVMIGPGSETLQTTALDSFTVAATTTAWDVQEVNAQSSYEVFYTPGQEPVLAGGEKFGIDVTTGASGTTLPNVRAKIWFEE